MTTDRIDWAPNQANRLNFRYSFQRENGTAASTLVRSIGSASQRQSSENKSNSFLANYTHLISPTKVNTFNFSFSTFLNDTLPVAPGPQLTFPSIQDGASFRVPQQTKQRRYQFGDTYTFLSGNHTVYVGGEIQRVESDLDLKVFQQGRIELIEDFPDFDRNGDGRVDDNDLLFAVTLRSGFQERSHILPDTDNTYFAGFFQDDWNFVFYSIAHGAQGILELVRLDGRPGAAWLYIFSFALLGYKPALWQLFSLLLRVLTTINFGLILNRLWPARRYGNLLICIFFLAYPFFVLQPLAVTFTQHFAS
jgi:hypothetical protein